MMISKHPSKEIQEAIDYALDNGWRIIESGKSAHAFVVYTVQKKVE